MKNFRPEEFQLKESEEQLATRLAVLLDTAEQLHAKLDLVAQNFSAAGDHKEADRLIEESTEFGRLITVCRDRVELAKIGNVLKGILLDSIVHLQEWIAKIREDAGVPEKKKEGVQVYSFDKARQMRRNSNQL